MSTFRAPTPEEKQELAQYMATLGSDYYTAVSWAEVASIVVFDPYTSDGPGYSGRVMVVVWPGGPELYEAFVWRSGKLVHVDTQIGPYQTERMPKR